MKQILFIGNFRLRDAPVFKPRRGYTPARWSGVRCRMSAAGSEILRRMFLKWISFHDEYVILDRNCRLTHMCRYQPNLKRITKFRAKSPQNRNYYLKAMFCFISQVLVDGPLTGVPRQEYRLANLHLTKFRIRFPYTAPTRIVRKAWKEFDVKAKWRETAWSLKAQSIRKVRSHGWRSASALLIVAFSLQRTQLNDFDRFKLRYAKRQRNKLLTVAFNTLKKRTKSDGTTRVLKKDRREKFLKLKAEKGKGKK